MQGLNRTVSIHFICLSDCMFVCKSNPTMNKRSTHPLNKLFQNRLIVIWKNSEFVWKTKAIISFEEHHTHNKAWWWEHQQLCLGTKSASLWYTTGKKKKKHCIFLHSNNPKHKSQVRIGMVSEEEDQGFKVAHWKARSKSHWEPVEKAENRRFSFSVIDSKCF